MLDEADPSLWQDNDDGGSTGPDDVWLVAIEIDRQARRTRVRLQISIAEIQAK